MCSFENFSFLQDFKMRRHCASCLIELNEAKVTLCTGCDRRAYCSNSCQTLDWDNGGQSHTIWCKLGCLEEDLDWEIIEVEGKGLGMVSKVVIKPFTRILIDKWFENGDGHPEIENLTPIDGSISDKYEMNSFSCSNSGGSGVVCPRISRVNHACDSNASHHSDEFNSCKILYSTRRILPGDEICINYSGCYDFAQQLPLSDLTKWGFDHDSECVLLKNPCLITRGRELDNLIQKDSFCKDGRALAYVKELLRIQDELGSIVGLLRSRTLFDGAQIAMMRSETVAKGLEYLHRSLDMDKKVLSPCDPDLMANQEFLLNPDNRTLDIL